MKDDILIIGEHHRKAAEQIIPWILPGIRNKPGKYLITVAGESGAGKSEIASALANLLDKASITTYIIQQDDYFILPPATNAGKRLQDINWVGPGEVKIELLIRQIKEVMAGKSVIEKPLVIFSDNLITEEIIDVSTYRVIIFEGCHRARNDSPRPAMQWRTVNLWMLSIT